MRIAVIGLLPDQARMIRQEFRGLDLRIAHKDTKEGAGASAVVTAGADRILVMSRFVGHRQIAGIDRSKTTFINGAMSSLRKALQNIDATHKAQPRAQKPVVLKEAETVNPKTNFKVLTTAKTGDVLVFHRPRQMTLAAWEQRIGIARSYYKKHYGVLSSSSFKDGEAHILIERAAGEAPKAPAEGKLWAAEKAAETPAIDQPLSIIPVNEMEQRFWQEVYLQSMRNNSGALAHVHAEFANNAVLAFRKGI